MYCSYILKGTEGWEKMSEKELFNRIRNNNQLMDYMKGILYWNDKVNLTNITDEEEFIKKHYIDSLLIKELDVFKNAETVIDVGTGGGFPGVPLAIMFPEKQFVLLDSLKKRLKIIDELTAKIGISNVITYHGRAEEAAHTEELREKFDLCVSRAVSRLSSLTELCLPFVKVGGNFAAYKGPAVYEEVKEAEKAIQILGGEFENIKVPEKQEKQEHTFVIIKKISKTSQKYPRKPGNPVRKPIK